MLKNSKIADGSVDFKNTLFRNLSSPQTYVEMVQQKNRLLSDASDFISSLR